MRATLLDFKDPREISQAKLYYPQTNKYGCSLGFKKAKEKPKNRASIRFQTKKPYQYLGQYNQGHLDISRQQKTSTVIYKKSQHKSLLPNSMSQFGHCRIFDPLNIQDVKLKQAFLRSGATTDLTRGLTFERRSRSSVRTRASDDIFQLTTKTQNIKKLKKKIQQKKQKEYKYIKKTRRNTSSSLTKYSTEKYKLKIKKQKTKTRIPAQIRKSSSNNRGRNRLMKDMKSCKNYLIQNIKNSQNTKRIKINLQSKFQFDQDDLGYNQFNQQLNTKYFITPKKFKKTSLKYYDKVLKKYQK